MRMCVSKKKSQKFVVVYLTIVSSFTLNFESMPIISILFFTLHKIPLLYNNEKKIPIKHLCIHTVWSANNATVIEFLSFQSFSSSNINYIYNGRQQHKIMTIFHTYPHTQFGILEAYNPIQYDPITASRFFNSKKKLPFSFAHAHVLFHFFFLFAFLVSLKLSVHSRARIFFFHLYPFHISHSLIFVV